MASYKLVIKKSVAKDLRPIPNRDVERILARIHLLIDDPRPQGAEKLSGEEKYRLRQGRYRIIYTINDAEVCVVVVKVGHRREMYRR
ncbi:MAG TPA: type II toxin-antitoxin system RelE/ParE family toxin [Gammaproteobacteria bacterium]|nr:type II toxin-antitoxin system RelE/ParE family toxin [Gammaproteobacteria bacterium]